MPAVPRRRQQSLNRTFYGIETVPGHPGHEGSCVLIVPFMELKLASPINLIMLSSLNRTFYGIETRYRFIFVERLCYCLNRTFYGIETNYLIKCN